MTERLSVGSLIKMGLVLQKDGSWARNLPKGSKVAVMMPGKPIKKPSQNDFKAPTNDYLIELDGSVTITLSGVIKGLNSTGGLMNSHWTMVRKEKERMTARVKALNPPQFKGKVKITFIRHTVRFMDWDNMVSTAKLPMDALVNNKVIEDDSPEFVVEFLPKQFKSKRADQRTEILITKI